MSGVAITGIRADDACLEMYNQIKMGTDVDGKKKKLMRWCTFVIDQEASKIIVEKTGEKAEKEDYEAEWNNFVESAICPAGSKPQCKYGIYEFTYVDNTSGYGEDVLKSKLLLITWIPDSIPPKQLKDKMLYSSTKNALNHLSVSHKIQANCRADLDFSTVTAAVL